MQDDLEGLDATAQADLVRRNEVSALELVERAIAHIVRLNPQLNAVIHTRFDAAREEAQEVVAGSAPFAGVPVPGEGPALHHGGRSDPFRHPRAARCAACARRPTPTWR